MNLIEVKFKVLPNGVGLSLPRYATPQSAGLDLSAAERIPFLFPGKRCLVPTGLAVELPEGFEGQVRPRSGLAAKHGITVLNSPGTIDQDYRGEIMVILINFGDSPFVINRGDRIAQFVIAPYIQATTYATYELSETIRGSGGLGSSGEGAVPFSIP